MNEFVKNNWQWVTGIVVSFAGIIISIWLTLAFQNKKAIASGVISSINVGKSIHPGMKVFYKDKIIEAGAITTVMIKNNGDQPVVAKDFDTPIEISFPEKSSVKDALVIEKIPANIKAVVEFKNNLVMLAPTLLNPGDHIKIQALVEGDIQEPTVTARIAGIGKVDSLDERREKIMKIIKYLFWSYCLVASMIYSLIIEGVIFKKYRYNGNIQLSFSASILTLSFMALSVMALSIFYLNYYTTVTDYRLFLLIAVMIVAGQLLSVPFKPRKIET